MQEHFDDFFEVTCSSHCLCLPVDMMIIVPCKNFKDFLSRWHFFLLLLSQEVFTEMEEKYGEVEEMNICDNLGDHLVGNVYVKVGVESEITPALTMEWIFPLQRNCRLFFHQQSFLMLFCSSAKRKTRKRL